MEAERGESAGPRGTDRNRLLLRDGRERLKDRLSEGHRGGSREVSVSAQNKLIELPHNAEKTHSERSAVRDVDGK